MNELLKTLNIDSEENFQIFLKKNNSFSIDEVREKIKIELFWNELIYSKHSNKLKIDRVAIIKKVDSLNDGEIKEYLLSEIVFNLNKNVSSDLVKLSIKEIGFNNTANVYSISNSSKLGGKLGWVKESSLSKEIIKKLKLIDEGKFTDVIKIGNNNLILNLEKIKITEVKIDKDKEVEKLIQIEANKQLSQFSNIYFNKSKINYSINEN
jgi:peptidyl-prolyl cis-trans isomerase SurA